MTSSTGPLAPTSELEELLALLGGAQDELEALRTRSPWPPPELAPADSAPSVEDVLAAAPPRRADLRVASITDEFTKMAFDPELALNPVGPEDWRERVAIDPPTMLLVESAWRGNGERWRARLSSLKRVDADLIALVDWCRARDIPTVFWNKEDPANFEFFKQTASLFDHILTTDADCIPRYRALTGHNRIEVLPFAAQPMIHNPVKVGNGRERRVAFAGTYYVRKHPDRKVQMEAVLDPARDFGLEIFSRVPDNPNFAYPDKYLPHIVGSLPYDKLLVAHKVYKIFLNVNSVFRSRTMCARRIFELLASGTGVVSGVSPAIASLLGPGLVCESDDPQHTRERLAAILGDDDARERLAVRGLRTVLRNHTYAHRVAAICRTVGLDPGTGPPTAAVLSCPDDREQALGVIAAVDRQRRQPEQTVLVCPPDVAATLPSVPGLRVVEAARGVSYGGRLHRGLDEVWADHVAILDPAATYGQHYLGDSLMAFAYTDAAIVGKRSVYAIERAGEPPVVSSPGAEYEYVGQVDDATVVLRRDAIRMEDLRDGPKRTLALLQALTYRRGARIFAADRFSFVGGPGAPGAGAALPAVAQA